MSPKKKQRAAAKSDAEVFQKNLFFLDSSREHHFCFLPQEDYLGMNLLRFLSSIWENFAAAEEQN